jgi:DNA-binding LytR/AlgR family response regulator
MVDKAMMKIYLNDILYVESLKNYVRIKTTSKEAITYHTLSYMEEKLPTRLFQRIHKSFLVNLEKIDRYSSEMMELGGKHLPIGKTYQEVVMQRLAERAI